MDYKFSKYNILIPNDDEIVNIYNCYTGKFCRLNREKFVYMSNNIFDEKVLNRFEAFVKNGFAVPNNYDEVSAVKSRRLSILLDDKRKDQKYVITPTLACNLHCPYCFEQGIKNNKSMTNDTVKQLLSMVENNLFPNTDKVYVTFFGGEPLLCFETIKEISKGLIKRLNKHGVKFISRIITNGVLLDFKTANILKTECNLEKVQITLDGLKENYCKRKNTSLKNYEQVINNIINISDIVDVRIRLNADKDNFNDLLNLARFLIIDLQLKNKIEIYFAQLRDYDNGKNEIYYNESEFITAKQEFYKYLKSLGQTVKNITPPKFNPLFCQLMQKGNYVIDPCGNLYKCEHCLGQNEMIIGDIKCGLINDEQIIDKNIDNPRCLSCNLYPICDFGCIAINKFTGNNECLIYEDKLNQIKLIGQTYLESIF